MAIMFPPPTIPPGEIQAAMRARGFAVATIANASQLLYVQGWDGWGIAPVTWTIIMLAAAVVVAALVAVTRRDVAYLAVPVWALTGIAIRQAPTPAVSLAAWVAAGIVVVLLIWSVVRPLRLPASADARLAA